jgi:transposase InsO family protein
MRTELVCDALDMAVAARGGHRAAAGVIAHADRASQYTSNDYLDYCQARQMHPSVGRTGVCRDNAVNESFWDHSNAKASKAECSQPAPKPAERSSSGSTGTTHRDFTRPSTTSAPSNGNSSTNKRHNHPSARRGDAQSSSVP